MADDRFPWDLVVVPIIISLIIGAVLGGLIVGFVKGSPAEIQPCTMEEGALIQDCSGNYEEEFMLFEREVDTMCKNMGYEIGDWSFSWDNVVCSLGNGNWKAITDIGIEYKENKAATVELQDSNAFIDAYLPNEYYCVTKVPVKYTLPVKVHFDVEKIRMVNKTVPVYEDFEAELNIPSGEDYCFPMILGDVEENDTVYIIKSNHSVDLNDYTLEDLQGIYSSCSNICLISSNTCFTPAGDFPINVRLTGRIHIGDKEEIVEETYMEDVYNYKEETKQVCEVVTVDVPLDLTLNERKKLRTEMESKSCYLTSKEASQNCNSFDFGDFIIYDRTFSAQEVQEIYEETISQGGGGGGAVIIE